MMGNESGTIENAFLGTWEFKDTLYYTNTPVLVENGNGRHISVNMSFISNGVQYEHLEVFVNDYLGYSANFWYRNAPSGSGETTLTTLAYYTNYSPNWWREVQYKTIIITRAPYEVSDGENVYPITAEQLKTVLDWLKANATKLTDGG